MKGKSTSQQGNKGNSKSVKTKSDREEIIAKKLEYSI